MRIRFRYPAAIVALGALAAGAYLALTTGRLNVGEYVQVQRLPALEPDYRGVTIPPNIAPLNFSVRETGSAFQVRISSTRGDRIEIASSDSRIFIPDGPWKELLRANRGQDLTFEVYVKDEKGEWRRFAPVVNSIASEEIDGYLAYRLLKPLYNKYVNVGIYQRDLQSFAEEEILQGSRADNTCINCHTFSRNLPEPMALQTRSRHGLTMLLARQGTVTTVETRTEFNTSPAAYTSWHPSGELVAFSVNKLSLFFHTAGETRDVFDAASDLAVYWIADNLLNTSAAISHLDSLETWPSWSPDGRHLYFCRAPKLPIERFREVRYDLMRIRFDPETRSWGTLETVLAAGETGLSISQPRVSPDGRFLLFCMAEYGNFPVYAQSSDLYLMDLESGSYRRLSINSQRTESWHSWSSNSRWIAFSSKRRDGLFSRPFLSYIDEGGAARKPFLLPQRDPDFYDSFIKTYNLPELIREPVRTRAEVLARAIYAPERPLKARLDGQVRVRAPGDDPPVREPYSVGTVR